MGTKASDDGHVKILDNAEEVSCRQLSPTEFADRGKFDVMGAASREWSGFDRILSIGEEIKGTLRGLRGVS